MVNMPVQVAAGKAGGAVHETTQLGSAADDVEPCTGVRTEHHRPRVEQINDALAWIQVRHAEDARCGTRSLGQRGAPGLCVEGFRHDAEELAMHPI